MTDNDDLDRLVAMAQRQADRWREPSLLILDPSGRPRITAGDRLPYCTLLSQADAWEKDPRNHRRIEPLGS